MKQRYFLVVKPDVPGLAKGTKLRLINKMGASHSRGPMYLMDRVDLGEAIIVNDCWMRRKSIIEEE